MTKIYKGMDVTPSGKMVFEIDYESLEKNEHWVKRNRKNKYEK